MKFLNSDLLAIGIGGAIITTFSLLFYFDITRQVQASGEEVVGKVTFRKEIAQRKFSNQVIWDDIEQNSPVYNYDSLRTADNSEATIHLKDGTEISVNENSMILLEMTSKELDIKFSHGSISAKRDNVDDDDVKDVKISSDTAVISIAKSDINLSQEMGKELNLTVNKGDAKIKSGDREEVIKENQQVIATKEEVKIYPLNLRLKEPQPQAYFILKEASQTVPFSWDPVDSKNTLTLEVSNTNDFNRPLISKNVAGVSEAVTLVPGIYYWRLKGINHLSKKMEFSGTRRFSIIHDEAVQLIIPSNNSVFSYKTSVPLINFRWAKGTNTSNYSLTIATDPELKNRVKSTRLNVNTISIDNLKEGSYFWKVEKELELGGEKHITTSSINRFSIVKIKTIAPPMPVYPPNNQKISRLQIKTKNFTFTWKNEPEVTSSKILISTDSDFSNLVYSTTTKMNFIQIDRDLAEGRYFWRIIGIQASGENTKPSETKRFNIVKSDDLVLIRPANNEMIGTDKSGSINFSWKKPEAKGKFMVEVSRNTDFKSIVKKQSTEDYSAYLSIEDPGNYYWRVRLLGDDNAELMKSDARKIQILTVLSTPSAIYPGEGSIVNMYDKNSIVFDWEELKGANLYEVEIFRASGGSLKSIFKTRTGSTNFRYGNLKMLDVGDFCWSLKGYQTDKNKKITRKSPEVKKYFKITLPQIKKDQIKLKSPSTLYIE